MPQNPNSTTPAPPPGFVPAGSVPAPPPGFVTAGQDSNAAPPTTPQKTSFGEDLANGFGSAAGETLINLGRMGSHIPVVPWVAEKVGDLTGLPHLAPGTNPYDATEHATAPARQAAYSTLGGKVGSSLENLGEWINGEEALKGLSAAEKLGLAAKLAKLAESHPAAAKLINAGLTAIRNTALGSAQAGVHGATPGQATVSGVAAGGTGAALDLASIGIGQLAPGVKRLLGVDVPVRASQKSAGAAAAENLAASKPLSRFNIEQTQPAAKRVVGNIATDVQNAAAQKLASDTQDFQAAVKELGNDKAFGDMPTAEQSKVLQRAQELKLARTNLAPAADLGDAAEQIRQQAKLTFAKLDKLTKDREATFSDWQQAERSAWRRGDFQGAMEAKGKQQAILDEFKDQFSPSELTNARAAWSQASALDKVHSALNTKAVVQPTPVEFRPKGTPDPGFINGKAFSRQVAKLSSDGTLTAAGLTPEHVQALQDLGTLLENGANVRKLNRLVVGGGALAEMLGFAVHPGAAATAAATAIPAYTASRLLGRIMTDPQAAALTVKALRAGARVAAPAAAQASRAILDGAKNSLSH